MADVAFLGLGGMGSRMAANLLKAGHRLSVWNRSPSAAEPLMAAGARQATTPRDAAVGAEFVITMVRDVDASRQVWLDPVSGAMAGMAPGATALESSTVSQDWIKVLGSEAAARGLRFLETPVTGTFPQAEAGQLIYLVGGEESILKKAEPLLKAMGSQIHHIGPVGSANLVKLTHNAMLAVQASALAELLGLLKRNGVDLARAVEALSNTAIWSPMTARHATSMLSGDFSSPMFAVTMMEKDLNYTLKAMGSPDAAPTIGASHHVFRNAISKGYGSLYHTAVAKLFME